MTRIYRHYSTRIDTISKSNVRSGKYKSFWLGATNTPSNKSSSMVSCMALSIAYFLLYFEQKYTKFSIYHFSKIDLNIIFQAITHSKKQRNFSTMCQAQPPIEPHAVYCCGSMYCHRCLVTKMTEASNQNQPTVCDHCGRSMGDTS